MRIDTAFRQSQLPAAKLLEIKLAQAFRASEIALRIMGDAAGGEEVGEVEPKAGLRVMRVTILEAFDVAQGLRLVQAEVDEIGISLKNGWISPEQAWADVLALEQVPVYAASVFYSGGAE